MSAWHSRDYWFIKDLSPQPNDRWHPRRRWKKDFRKTSRLCRSFSCRYNNCWTNGKRPPNLLVLLVLYISIYSFYSNFVLFFKTASLISRSLSGSLPRTTVCSSCQMKLPFYLWFNKFFFFFFFFFGAFLVIRCHGHGRCTLAILTTLWPCGAVCQPCVCLYVCRQHDFFFFSIFRSFFMCVRTIYFQAKRPLAWLDLV